MIEVKFTIPGDPFGKQRPRFVRSGHTYTPKPTRDYEALVKQCYLEQVGTRKFDGPVGIIIRALCKIPKSTSKKVRSKIAAGFVKPTKKPDADNIAKIIMDGLNGLAYDDDNAVTELHVKKEYADNPRVEVQLIQVGTDQLKDLRGAKRMAEERGDKIRSTEK